MIMMILSGWQIYNASPLFPFDFPIGLGGWLAGALLWHFAAMWLLVVNGLVYLALGIATGRFQHKLLPIRVSEVVRDFLASLRGHALACGPVGLQRGATAALSRRYPGGHRGVLSGLSIWKPVQVQELTALFGGYDAARFVHFFAMATIVSFLVIHVALALMVPKSLRAMVIGR